MHDILTIDGISYPVNIVSLTETSEFANKYATRTENWDLRRELSGIFFNFEMTIGEIQNPATAAALWDKLHEMEEFHTFKLPHNNGFLTFQGYVSGVSRPLKRRKGGVNYWGGYTIKFIAKKPQIQ